MTVTKKKSKKVREKVYSNRIKKYLLENEMCQQELADIVGVDCSHLSKIILGKKRHISLLLASSISKALKQPIENVFILKNERKEEKAQKEKETV